ncbi:hypothetical protein cypCar_00015288 [Cyprinus carpio]|nr:hypothetical protein cypCar_00015288 [Cyprinus carpio]
MLPLSLWPAFKHRAHVCGCLSSSCLSGNPDSLCSFPPFLCTGRTSSEWWLVHMGHMVSLQCYLWSGVAEEEPELHQPHSPERRDVLRGPECPEKCLHCHLSRLLIVLPLRVYVYVFVQWMEVGASGVSGRHAEPTAPCGGAGNVPNLHPAPVGRTARAWIFNPSTAPVSSAHRVSTTISVP